ncbi:MAG: pentapeptide repeat-containing protein [Alphaproteobacteria bacterium]
MFRLTISIAISSDVTAPLPFGAADATTFAVVLADALLAFLGANFLGANFLGANFLGANFLGADFLAAEDLAAAATAGFLATFVLVLAGALRAEDFAFLTAIGWLPNVYDRSRACARDRSNIETLKNSR